MARTWTQRREALLSDCIVSPDVEDVSNLWLCYPLGVREHLNAREGSDDYPSATLPLYRLSATPMIPLICCYINSF